MQVNNNLIVNSTERIVSGGDASLWIVKGLGWDNDLMNHQYGDYYTFSFYASWKGFKPKEGSKNQLVLSVPLKNDEGKSLAYKQLQIVPEIENQEYKRFEITHRFDVDNILIEKVIFSTQIQCDEVILEYPKIEKGQIATQYCPNKSDLSIENKPFYIGGGTTPLSKVSNFQHHYQGGGLC